MSNASYHFGKTGFAYVFRTFYCDSCFKDAQTGQTYHWKSTIQRVHVVRALHERTDFSLRNLKIFVLEGLECITPGKGRILSSMLLSEHLGDIPEAGHKLAVRHLIQSTFPSHNFSIARQDLRGSRTC